MKRGNGLMWLTRMLLRKSMIFIECNFLIIVEEKMGGRGSVSGAGDAGASERRGGVK
jgi:hypothetical protein